MVEGAATAGDGNRADAILEIQAGAWPEAVRGENIDENVIESVAMADPVRRDAVGLEAVSPQPYDEVPGPAAYGFGLAQGIDVSGPPRRLAAGGETVQFDHAGPDERP